MSDTITMDSAGRVVLPKPIREKFRLKGGAKLRLITIGDHLELTPIELEDAPALVKKNGLLVVASTGVPCDAVEVIEAERKDRESLRR